MIRSKVIVVVGILLCLIVGFAQDKEIQLSTECMQKLDDKNGWYPILGKDNWMFKYSLDFSVGSASPSDSDTFLNLVKSLKNKNIVLSMIILPLRASISPDLFGTDSSFRSYDITTAQMNYEKTIEDINDLGVYAPDLLALAQSLDNLEERTFFLRQENHWSSLGASLAAESLAEILPKNLFGEANVDVIRTGEFELIGNFAKQLQRHCGEYKNIFAPKIELLPRYSSQDLSMGLLDEVMEFDTVLVGTSQSAMSEWGFQVFLEMQLSQLIENKAIKAGGGWQSLVTYVASPQFADNPPKHIIWELPYNWLIAILSENPRNEIYYNQLFASLEGKCLNELEPATYNDTAEVELAIEGINMPIYLQVDISNPEDNVLQFVIESSEDTEKIELIREGFAIDHGRYHYKFSNFDGITSIKLLLNQEVEELQVKICAS